MAFDGGWDGSGGGGGTPSWPPIIVGDPTTAASIRDRIMTVIEALTPDVLAGDKFRRYRNEGGGDFLAWLEANANSCQRRFQVRDLGDLTEPEVSNTDVEWRELTFRVIVAYPQSHRAGAQNALDRDDMIDADRAQIAEAIGHGGGPNFADPYPNACHVRTATSRDAGSGFDVLVIDQVMGFYRTA